MNDGVEQNPPTGKPRVLIVGGVAGGASCAARARRLSESAEIIVYERGQHVSFASCGLPYYVGKVIPEEKNLLVATPVLFQNRFNIAVKLRTEVLSVFREKQSIVVKDLETGVEREEHYDALVLSPGSIASLPPVPGVDLPGIFTLRTIQDSQNIKEWMVKKKVKSAVVVGGGFIGLETVENLVNLGISVTVVEMLPQVMSNLDPEIAVRLQERLVARGVDLRLGDGVTSFEPDPVNDKLVIKTHSGASLEFDMVLLATGVHPETTLAKKAGLEIGKLGGIRVDSRMRTSDSKIWAVGDAVEVKNFITGEWGLTPLAGPASRQGRIAADVIMGRKSEFRGVQSTAVCEVLGLTVATTGLCEKALRNLSEKIPYEKVYLHVGHHAGYYPGAKMISLKLLFSTRDGAVLGAQAIGEEGVEKRIDIISMVIQKGGTVFDLEEAELCYAPQFGAAKDPVNMAGMVAANVLKGDSPVVHWTDHPESQSLILDVREPSEYTLGHFDGALNIPLGNLRNRLSELPRDKEIAVYCGVGQRSYYATRILQQKGYSVKNVSGGFTSFKTQSQMKE